MPDSAVPVATGSSRARTARVAAFQVSRLNFPPALRLPSHTHERPTIAVILAGSFDEVAGSSRQACGAGTVLSEPAGAPHSNHFDRAGAEVLVVQPDPSELEQLEPFATLLAEPHHLHDLTVAGLARRAAVELGRRDAVAPFALEGLVLDLLAETVRARGRAVAAIERRPPAWLAEAKALLHDRALEPLSVYEVASAVGVHPVHLTRTFRTYYGLPVGSYLRGLRLQWAATRLAGGADPITEIALASGFYDQSHFTRCFKGQFGLTPLAYREAAAS